MSLRSVRPLRSRALSWPAVRPDGCRQRPVPALRRRGRASSCRPARATSRGRGAPTIAAPHQPHPCDGPAWCARQRAHRHDRCSARAPSGARPTASSVATPNRERSAARSRSFNPPTDPGQPSRRLQPPSLRSPPTRRSVATSSARTATSALARHPAPPRTASPASAQLPTTVLRLRCTALPTRVRIVPGRYSVSAAHTAPHHRDRAHGGLAGGDEHGPSADRGRRNAAARRVGPHRLVVRRRERERVCLGCAWEHSLPLASAGGCLRRPGCPQLSRCAHFMRCSSRLRSHASGTTPPLGPQRAFVRWAVMAESARAVPARPLPDGHANSTAWLTWISPRQGIRISSTRHDTKAVVTGRPPAPGH